MGTETIVNKRLSKTDVQKGYLNVTQDLPLTPGAPVSICYGGKYYPGSTDYHCHVFGMGQIFQEHNLKPKDGLQMVFRPEENCIYLKKIRPYTEQTGSAEKKTWKDRIPKRPLYFETLVRTDFWIQKKHTKRDILQDHRERQMQKVFEKDLRPVIQAEAVFGAWRDGISFWAVCRDGDTVRLCRKEKWDSPLAEIAVLDETGGWREGNLRLHRLKDNTMLLESSCCLCFFTEEGILEEISFPVMEEVGGLYAIEPKGETRRDWLYVWGKPPKEMNAFWWDGQRVPGSALAKCPRMADLESLIRKDIWRSAPECLPWILPQARFRYNAPRHVFEVWFWGKGLNGVKGAKSLLTSLRSMARRSFFITPDCSTVMTSRGEVWEKKEADPAAGDMPDWAKQCGDILYLSKAVQAMYAGRVDRIPNLEEEHHRILAWYPDAQAVALRFQPSQKRWEERYFAMLVGNEPRYLAFRFAKTMQELQSGQGKLLRALRCYQGFLQTETFLGSGDGSLELLAEVLTERMRLLHLHPDTAQVTASDLAPLVYGVTRWESGQYAEVNIDLSPYRLRKWERVAVDLLHRTVRNAEKHKPLWQELSSAPVDGAGEDTRSPDPEIPQR